MAISANTIAQVGTGATFSGWLNQTNLLANAVTQVVLTADNGGSFGGANTLPTSGTVTHNGAFIANSISALYFTGVGGSANISSTTLNLDSSSPIVSNSTVTAVTVTSNTVAANAATANTLAVNTSATFAGVVTVSNTGIAIGNSTVSANLTIYGQIVTSNNISGFNLSDARLKDHVTEIDPSKALDAVLAAPGVGFDWLPESGLSGHDLGIIAQSIEPFFGEIVRADEKGYKNVNYTKLIPVLIQAIRAQHDAIVKLEARIVKLEANT